MKLRNLQSELSSMGRKSNVSPLSQRGVLEKKSYENVPYESYAERQGHHENKVNNYPHPFDSGAGMPRTHSASALHGSFQDQQQYAIPKQPSPKKSKMTAKQEITITEVRTRLRKVFQFYTSFGDRCNASSLKSNKFHKMMLDAGVREYLSQKQLDLLFVAENKHKPNMNFDTFLNLLAKIAKAMFKNENMPDSKCLDLLLRHHLFPLYESLHNETEMGLDEQKFNEEIDEFVIVILRSVHTLLMKMYQVYFPWEIQTSQQLNVVKQRTENALFIFLKEFDICPALITKSTAFLIWTEVLDTPVNKLTKSARNPSIIPFLDKDFGTLFTFSRFLAFLARCAIIAYDNQLGPNSRKFSNAERLALMLERMELSPGMLSFEKKTCIPHNSKTSLIVPKEILEKILGGPEHPEDVVSTTRMPNHPEPSESLLRDKRSRSEVRLHSMLRDHSANKSARNESSRARSRDNSRYHGDESHTFLKLTKYQFESPESLEVFDKYKDNLQRVFQYYCSFGEPMNTTKLKSIKYMRMLKEAELLQPGFGKQGGDHSFRILDNVRFYENVGNRTLSQIDADMVFVSLTGSKQLKELNEKNLGYDKNVKSPNIGYYNHLTKSASQVQVTSKLDYEGFLRAIEMIAMKLFPEWEVGKGVRYLVEKHFLRLDQQITQIALEQNKAVSGQPLQLLVDILKDPEMVNLIDF